MDRRCLTFTTVRDLEAGEELMMDYAQDSRSKILCCESTKEQHGQAEGAPQVDGCPTSTFDESAQGWSTR
jgi:hypothetical protein